MNEPMIRLDGQARRFAAAERRTKPEEAPAPTPKETAAVQPLMAGG